MNKDFNTDTTAITTAVAAATPQNANYYKSEKNVNYCTNDENADKNNNDYDDNNYDDDEDYDDYDDMLSNNGHYDDDDGLIDEEDPYENDPEYFEYKCFYIKDLKNTLNEKTEKISQLLEIKLLEANDLLKKFKWNYFKIVDLVAKDRDLFIETYLNDNNNNNKTQLVSSSTGLTLSKLALLPNKQDTCAICYDKKDIKNEMDCLDCMHLYCKSCWRTYFEQLIRQTNTSIFECMNTKCKLIANEEFIFKQLDRNKDLCDRYLKLCEYDVIKFCEDFRHCPGVECNYIVWGRPLSRRVNCKSCRTQFCFLCTYSYHAPNSCDIIRKWHIKCHDDSETRNYLLVHTQDCPACKVCIEKNGGCSHMTCNRCKHEFCWVCLNDWKTHGATYDCNRYKANPTQDQARDALNRYTHYYHRWINHANSLKFEKAFKEKCDLKINEKIMNGTCGTLVDWEFLIEAADILTKARYTLQYTYPYAYYLENHEIKLLFENIQAELEREVENLSHSLEKANLNDKYDVKTQMSIVEKRRKTLLKDFIR
jgi:ariadne-2